MDLINRANPDSGSCTKYPVLAKAEDKTDNVPAAILPPMTTMLTESKTEVRLRPVKGRESFKSKRSSKSPSNRPSSWHVNRGEDSTELLQEKTSENEGKNYKNEEQKLISPTRSRNGIYEPSKEATNKTFAHFSSSESINTFNNYHPVTSSKSTPTLSEDINIDDKTSFSIPQPLCGSKSTTALDKEHLNKPHGLLKSASGLTISKKCFKDQYSSMDNINMPRDFRWNHYRSSSMPYYYNANRCHDYVHSYSSLPEQPEDLKRIQKDIYYGKEHVNKYEKYEHYNPLFSQNSPKDDFSQDVWCHPNQVPFVKKPHSWSLRGQFNKIPPKDDRPLSPQKHTPAPIPPIRDASSLKYIKYGPSHEKHPSWPVTGPSSNNPGSHRTHSWTDQTDYPKEKDIFIRPKKASETFTPMHPVQEKSTTVSNSKFINTDSEEIKKVGPVRYVRAPAIGQDTSKTLLNEREKSKFDFNSHYTSWSSYIPSYDSEGRGYGDKDYNVPSPPERDVPVSGNDGHSGISQKELDDYAKKYDDVLQHYAHTGTIQSKIELFENSKVNYQKKVDDVPLLNHHHKSNFTYIDADSANYIKKKLETQEDSWQNKETDPKTNDALSSPSSFKQNTNLSDNNESSTPLMDRLCRESQQHFQNLDSYQQQPVTVKENILQNIKNWKKPCNNNDFCSSDDFERHDSDFSAELRQVSARQSKNRINLKMQTIAQKEWPQLPDKKPVESIVHSSKVQLPQRYSSESVLHYPKDVLTKNRIYSSSEDGKNCDDVFEPCSLSSGSDSRRSSDSFVRTHMWLDQEDKKNQINSLQCHIRPENWQHELKKSTSFSSSSVDLDSRPLSPVSDQVYHAQLWYEKQCPKSGYDTKAHYPDEKSKYAHKHSFFDPSKKHKISDPELKAIQKEAVRSFIEMKTGSQSSRSSSSSGSFRINENKIYWDVARIQPLPPTKANLSSFGESNFYEYAIQADRLSQDLMPFRPKSQSLPRDYYTEFKQYQKKHDHEHKQKIHSPNESKSDRNSKSKLEAVPEQLSLDDQNKDDQNKVLPSTYLQPERPKKLDIPVLCNDASRWPSGNLISPVSPTGPPPPYDDNHAREWYMKKAMNNQSLEHENICQPSTQNLPLSPNHHLPSVKHLSLPPNHNIISENMPEPWMCKSEDNMEAPVFSKCLSVTRAQPQNVQIHHAKVIEQQMSPSEDYSNQHNKETNINESSTGEIIGKSHKNCKNLVNELHLFQENSNGKTSIANEEIERLDKRLSKSEKLFKPLNFGADLNSNQDSLKTYGHEAELSEHRNNCSEDHLLGEIPFPPPPSPLNNNSFHRDYCSSPELPLPPPPILDVEIVKDSPLPPPPPPEEMAFKLQSSKAYTLTYYKDSYMQYRNEHHPGRKGFGGEYTRSSPNSPSDIGKPPFAVSASSSSLSATAWEMEHNIGHRSSTVIFNSTDLYPNSSAEGSSTSTSNEDLTELNSNPDIQNEDVKNSLFIKEARTDSLKDKLIWETDINNSFQEKDTVLKQTNTEKTDSKDNKSQDEFDRLSEDLCRQLNDRILTSLLIPSSHKTTADYMEGLFEVNINTDCHLNRRQHSHSPKKSTVSPPIGFVPPKRLSDTSLPPTSAYFTTSESKAKLLTRFNRDIRQETLNNDVSTAELDKKKEDLIERIDKKLKVLGNIQESIKEEMCENEELGQLVTSRIEKVAKPNEIEKYKWHTAELDTITNLLFSLSGRLARAENALFSLPEDTIEEERNCLTAKRDKLLEQHEEAKKLKESIDQRSQQVAQFLKDYLTKDEFEDYNHFVKMKSKLIMDAREIDDKIKLGLEQLAALKNNFSSLS